MFIQAFQFNRERGFMVLAIFVAAGFLLVITSALTHMIATSHQMALRQYKSDQAFALAHAAMEFGIRKRVKEGASPGLYTRQLTGGGQFTLSESGGVFYVTAVKDDATANYQMTIPVLP